MKCCLEISKFGYPGFKDQKDTQKTGNLKCDALRLPAEFLIPGMLLCANQRPVFFQPHISVCRAEVDVDRILKTIVSHCEQLTPVAQMIGGVICCNVILNGLRHI